MLGGYFNRDDALEELLSTYNDEFPMEQEVAKRLDQTLAFIDECGFDSKSRVWKRNDLFTLIVELDRAFIEGLALQPSVVVESLNAFFKSVDQGSLESGDIVATTYYKAAVQASNDRINRERRGQIIRDVLRGIEPLNQLLGV